MLLWTEALSLKFSEWVQEMTGLIFKRLTIAICIQAGIWGSSIFLQNLDLCLIVQICVGQSCSWANFPVVRVTVALSMAVGPADISSMFP